MKVSVLFLMVSLLSAGAVSADTFKNTKEGWDQKAEELRQALSKQ